MLAHDAVVDRYSAARRDFSNALERTGLSRDEIDALIEVSERAWTPGFGDSSARWRENDAVRRAFDRAQRAGVPESVFSAFVARLGDYRQSGAQVNAWERELYSSGSASAVTVANEEARRFQEVRDAVLAIARTMNPATTLEATLRPLDGGAATFDPLKRLLTVSLDVTQVDPRQEAYRALWGSVDGLLTDAERRVLDEHYAKTLRESGRPGRGGPDAPQFDPRDRTAVMAAAFADWAAPEGTKRKPDGFLAGVEKKVGTFFERVGNAARLRGFQAVEDVWRKAAEGRLAERSKDAPEGLRVPDPKTDKQGHDRFRASVKTLTPAQLELKIREQNDAIFALRKERSGLIAGLKRTVVGEKARGHGFSIRPWTGQVRDMERRHKEMVRGLTALMAERRDRQSAGVEAIAAVGGVPPGPGRPQPVPDLGPSSGGNGASPSRAHPQQADPRVAAVMAGLASSGAATVEGAQGAYMVSASQSPAPDGRPYPYQVRLAGAQGTVDLGMVSTPQAAVTMVSAVDGAVGGRASALDTRVLAHKANQAGAGDIDFIRKSGLLDERLDRLIGDKDAYAFVYPLKTGDVVFMTDEGRWQGGTLTEFRDYAMNRGNHHLREAAEVIDIEARMGGRRTRDGALGPAVASTRRDEGSAPRDPSPSAARPPQTERPMVDLRAAAPSARDLAAAAPSAPAEEKVALAARVAPGMDVSPLRVPEKDREAARADLRETNSEALLRRYEATQAALAAARSGESSAAKAREAMELGGGLNAMRAEMKDRGIPVPQDPARAERAKEKAKGNEGR